MGVTYGSLRFAAWCPAYFLFGMRCVEWGGMAVDDLEVNV